AWLNGAEIDWSQLHRDIKPKRISLPAYSFDRKRFWFAEAREEMRKAATASGASGPNGAPGGNGARSTSARLAEPAKSVRTPLLKSPSPAISTESIAEVLARTLAETLYMDVSDIKLGDPFSDIGLDSVTGVEWIQAVNRHFGVKISATRVYDHSNILDFAAFLSSQLERRPAQKIQELASAGTASLDEVLERVRSGDLDVGEAEYLIENLSLSEVYEGKS
ncbi:MAG: phosphopantetheine-binding protein, partial [Pseudanabaenales cyanobacterium]|nr:phosphopantetheine-binding protein [Pseudanabaenales cyanobacterium]